MPEPATTRTPHGFVVFDYFPALKALGQARLQELCDAWARTPDASKLDVASVRVADEGESLALTFRRGGRDQATLGLRHNVFLHDLVLFLAGHGLTGADREVCERLAAPLAPRPSPVPYPDRSPGAKLGPA